MLTNDQKGYLNTVPDDKIARVVAFDPATQTTAQQLIAEIESALPEAKIFYIGSSQLGIAGENDIDLTVLGEGDFANCLSILERMYGVPAYMNSENQYVKWEFVRNGFLVELHLMAFMTPSFQQQLDTQKILESNADLRAEFEHIKLECNGLSWKVYLTKKYEFWNRVLGLGE